MQAPNKTWLTLCCPFLFSAFLCLPAFAQDRTLDEFKEYASGRLAGMSDEQLTEFAKLVDKDSDGVITQAEFDDRMEILQKMQSGEMDKSEKEVPENEAEKKETKQDDPEAQRRNRMRSMNNRMQKRLDDAGIKPGKSLPDVAGLDIEGKSFPLSDLKGNYSVIVSGCLT